LSHKSGGLKDDEELYSCGYTEDPETALNPFPVTFKTPRFAESDTVCIPAGNV
jgi:hypothetical protein